MRKCSVCGEVLEASEFNKGRCECRNCSKRIQKEKYWKNKGRCADITEKMCKVCGKILPISKFDKKGCAKDGYRPECKDCGNIWRKEWRYRTGEDKPPSPTHARNVWLGITIGEEVASRYFKNPQRAPYGTPGYDLICQNGFKIDVKVATFARGGWVFHVKNRSGTKPDYYLLIAMESSEVLTPCHIWLVPANGQIGNKMICERSSFGISPKTISKLSQYEKPIEKLTCICNSMYEEGGQ
jgi:hypothetical protein